MQDPTARLVEWAESARLLALPGPQALPAKRVLVVAAQAARRRILARLALGCSAAALT